MPWPFSQEGPPSPAAPKLTYPPTPSYKDVLTDPSISPGEKLAKGVKAAKEQAQTVVDLFDQMAWAADDSEKALKLATERLKVMNEYGERLISGQKDYASEMAGLSPFLADQLKWKELAIQKELELKFRTLDRELDEKKINQAIYDQEKGMAALVTQAKKYSLEREKWATEGVSGGIKLFALELRQESETALAFGIRDGLKGAKGFADEALTELIMSPFTKKKMDFKHIGLDIATSITSGLVKMTTTRIWSWFADGAMGMVSTWQAAQQAMTAASVAGEAARLGTMASGASQGIGILESLAKGTILIQAGQAAAGAFKSVMQAVPFPFNVALAPIVAAAAFAATLAFGSGFGGGGGASTGYTPDYARHSGGLIAHRGLIVAHGGYNLASDERLILAQTGEGIISRRGMERLGPGEFEAINRGERSGGGGNTIINQNIGPTQIYPRQQMTQHDYNRQARMNKKALKRELGKGSRGLD